MGSAALSELLGSSFTEVVRDPVWGNIWLSPGIEAIAGAEPFSRLRGIRQLGPAHLVYPGATHTRHAHSLGVYHTARRILLALGRRGSIGFASTAGIFSFLVAALCHDLGHFPFAHSLKELPLAEHEALTARLLLAEPLRSLAGLAGADPEAAAAIVDTELPDGGSREVRFFRSLLSGVLDPDKLDYLNRDAYHCGVPYGVQDTEFILERLALAPGDRPGIEEKGLMSVEGVLFAKYLMYRSVYWHRGVRAATAAVKKAILLALREAVLSPEELYGLDDAAFAAILRQRDFAPFALAREALAGKAPRPVLDLPFDPGDPRHAALSAPEARLALEEELARLASRGRLPVDPLAVVVDLPEPVSFESDLPVLLEEGGVLPFGESPTVFAGPVVGGFTRALRRVRVFCRGAGLSEALGRAARELLG